MTEPLIVSTPAGEEMVVIPRAEYQRFLAAAAEDADDVAIYDARTAELASDPRGVLPAEVSLAMLKGASRFKALRRWSRLSQSTLAAKSEIGQGLSLRNRKPPKDRKRGDIGQTGGGFGRAGEMVGVRAARSGDATQGIVSKRDHISRIYETQRRTRHVFCCNLERW